jgi:cobaltochelatase CobT
MLDTILHFFKLAKIFFAKHILLIDNDYKIFTTAYDEIVDAQKLLRKLPALSAEDTRKFEDASNRFNAVLAEQRSSTAAAAAALVSELECSLTSVERSQSIVSFLIDHSGSMRGLPIIHALLAVEGAVDALAQAGVATEILGFTTTSWKGGRSRQTWLGVGKFPNPGRLCDLRHIIYGAANRTVRHPPLMQMALRPDILHENIDGEALIWSAGRLSKKKWKRRVLILVSDGAPVDDSTLLSNADKNILRRHLDAVEHRLAVEGFVIGTLCLHKPEGQGPPLFEVAEETAAVIPAILRLIRLALLEHRPRTS